MANGYRRISLFNHEIVVPNVPLREEVDVHLIPDRERGALEIRIWWNSRMVHSVAYPLKGFPRVHFSSFPNNSENSFSLCPTACPVSPTPSTWYNWQSDNFVCQFFGNRQCHFLPFLALTLFIKPGYLAYRLFLAKTPLCKFYQFW